MYISINMQGSSANFNGQIDSRREIRSSSRRGEDRVKLEGGKQYLAVACLTLLENMKIWCEIQVMIYPLDYPITKTYLYQKSTIFYCLFYLG